MATAPSEPEAPAAAASRARPWRQVSAAAATAVGVAAALRVLHEPSNVNYDARYALLWARDLAQGYTPEYTADFAPTPHPLQTAASLLALPFGDQADQVVLWTVLLCFGALVYLVYRLGAELFSPWVGLVTALVVVTRPALQRDAILAYQDVPFAALIVGAVLLEARRPRRGVAVLAVLAIAGLLRPEAWALAGLYSLYLWRGLGWRGRAGAAALTAAAPVVWLGSDWLITGDVLHSMHGTAALAEAVDRRRELSQVPYWTAQYFGFALREPLVAGIPIGLAFAWVHRRHRAVLPLAVAAAMTFVFAVGPLFGLPLIGRYVRTPAMLLALFYGLAVAGWATLPRGTSRRRWMVAGVVAAGFSLAYLPWHVSMIRSLDARTDRANAFYDSLRRVGEDPRVRAAVRACGPLSTADHRPIPFIRFWLDAPPGSVGTVKAGASPLGEVFLAPRRTPANLQRFGPNFPADTAPESYEVLYRNAVWRVDVAPGCVTRPPS